MAVTPLKMRDRGGPAQVSAAVLSSCDRLTGVWNRRHFDQLIGREIAFSEVQHSPLSVMIFDVDHFAAVNERHGRAVGDNVLRLTAARLRAACRPSDLLFRWGHDQFVLLTAATSGAAAFGVAERLRGRISAQEMPLAGTLTVSAGVAEHRPGESASRLLERITDALAVSKADGGNRVTLSRGGASELWQAQRRGAALKLVWSDAMISGHPLFDEQHRALFDATNKLIAAMNDETVALPALLDRLDGVLESVARHFAEEERVLAETGCPGLEPHRALHRRLLEGARRLRAGVPAGVTSLAEAVEYLAFEIVKRHVLRSDQEFLPYVAQLQAA